MLCRIHARRRRRSIGIVSHTVVVCEGFGEPIGRADEGRFCVDILERTSALSHFTKATHQLRMFEGKSCSRPRVAAGLCQKCSRSVRWVYCSRLWQIRVYSCLPRHWLKDSKVKRGISSSVKSGKVLRRNVTKLSSVTMFCGVKDGPSFALLCRLLASNHSFRNDYSPQQVYDFH